MTSAVFCFQEVSVRESGSVLFQIETLPTPTSAVLDPRLEHLRDYCSSPEIIIDRRNFRDEFKFQKRSSYFLFTKFNVAYCKVPKVASTFMMEMFEILTSGHSEVNQSRISVHSRTDVAQLNRTNIWPTVTAARNPYSRLYSAYVDKILLPNMFNTTKHIKAQLAVNNVTVTGSGCPDDISFEEFLLYINLTARSPVILNRHWAPVNSLCHMCNNINRMIIKQETFTEDIEKLMGVLNVSESSASHVTDLMGKKRLHSTIPGIVKAVFSFRPEFSDCLTDMQVMKKLWLSFQIQGYLNNDQRFPRESIEELPTKELADYFSEFVIKRAEESALTSETSKAQRDRYLTDAYASVSETTLEEIKRLYQADFIMFQYSMNPP